MSSSNISRFTNRRLSYDEEIIIMDFIHQESDSIEKGKGRGNCGVVAADFVGFVKRNYPGTEVFRIEGEFKTDNPSFDKEDFHSTELAEMLKENLDKNSEADRETFYESLPQETQDEFFRVAHYWNKLNGKIIDFSGYYQFVESKLSPDTKDSRYIT